MTCIATLSLDAAPRAPFMSSAILGIFSQTSRQVRSYDRPVNGWMSEIPAKTTTI